MTNSLKRMPSTDFEAFDDVHLQKDGAYSDVDEESLGPLDPLKTTPVYHIHQAEEAMMTLKQVFRDPGWKKMNTTRSVTVWAKSGVTREDKIPLFKGEGVIRGFTPQSVFAVIGMRALWDEWYEEGNLVENLNDTTSLTYMVMKALSGSKKRDLSLVEKIECTSTGTIFFVSTSVDTPKVPRVSDKVRAKLKLNGWILEPVATTPPSTRVTYILQTAVGGWFPAVLVNKYMSKRPLVIHAVDHYLQKNGPPPMVVNTAPSPRLRRPSESPSRTESITLPFEHDMQRKSSFSNLSMRGIDKVSSPLQTIVQRSIPEPVSSPEEPYNASGVGTSTSVQRSPVRPSNIEPSESVPSPAKSLPTPTFDAAHSVVINPHSNHIRKALEITKNNCVSMDSWSFYSESKGVKIYTKESPGKSMPIIRGDSTITGGWTAEDILSIVVCLDMRKLWDDRYEDGEIIKYFNNDDVLLRTAMKGTFPISGRDVLCALTTERNDVTGAIWTVSTSVVDAAVPESRKYVRANLAFAGWHFRPHIDKSGFTTAVDVTYLVDIDIKLDNIPSSILKTLSMSTPLCIARVQDVLQKHGPPPYVIRSTAKISRTQMDMKTHQYELTLTSAADSTTDLKVSRKMYPEGFDISSGTDNVKAELLPNNSEVVRITVPRGSSESITLQVTKQISKSNQITLNGENSIPIAAVRTPPPVAVGPTPAAAGPAPPTVAFAPPPIARANGLVNGIHQSITSRNGSLNGNSNVLPGSSSRSLPKKSRKPSQQGRQAAINPQTFVRTEIQAPAKIIQQSPVIEKHVQQETKFQNGTSIPTVGTPGTPGSPGSPVPVYPIHDVIIISDALRFNAHQVALIFAAMLLAYYAGKMSDCTK